MTVNLVDENRDLRADNERLRAALVAAESPGVWCQCGCDDCIDCNARTARIVARAAKAHEEFLATFRVRSVGVETATHDN